MHLDVHRILAPESREQCGECSALVHLRGIRLCRATAAHGRSTPPDTTQGLECVRAGQTRRLVHTVVVQYHVNDLVNGGHHVNDGGGPQETHPCADRLVFDLGRLLLLLLFGLVKLSLEQLLVYDQHGLDAFQLARAGNPLGV